MSKFSKKEYEHANQIVSNLQYSEWTTTTDLLRRMNGQFARFATLTLCHELVRRGVLFSRGEGKLRWKLHTDYSQSNINPLEHATKNETTPSHDKPLSNVYAIKSEHGLMWELKGETYVHRSRIAAIGSGSINFDKLRKSWVFPIVNTTCRSALEAVGVKFYDDEEPNPVEPEKVVEKEPAPETSTNITSLIDMIQKFQNEVEKLRGEVGKTQKTEITITRPDETSVTLNEHVHPIFKQVLFHIQCGDSVMLVGPRGCGKTHLCEQVSKALGFDFGMLSLSGGVTESKLFGRTTPNIQTGESVFHAAPFADAYEKGGVFLLDEVDAADPNVLLSLNSALSNGKLALDRPKKPLVSRHKDFICMAAANTWGNGADRQYIGRNQQDGAFVERFVALGMDYDTTLELKLCAGFENIVTHYHAYRERLGAARLERCISTRFILRAVNWIKNGQDLTYTDSMLFGGWRKEEINKVRGY